MTATQFRNASGLPDPDQVTTARDVITLALRLQDDFPGHYPLFSTRTFTHAGQTYRNHNTLLFRYKGTDGLKTGYTRASGFNVVASVRRGRKHVVGVVFGGASAATRNATMRTYLNMALMKASSQRTRRPAARLVARTGPSPGVAVAPPAPQTQSDSPAIEMARVRPVLVPGATSAAPPPPDSIEALLARPALMTLPPPPAEASWSDPPATGGAFQIQVGAFQSQTEAERQLAAVRERAGSLLHNHAAVTTPLQRGARTIYRARYAGFQAHATAAGVCSALKRLSISCLVMAAE
jgi:D-alanyl-D-alanine carboxypeptidase